MAKKALKKQKTNKFHAKRLAKKKKKNKSHNPRAHN